MDNLRLSDEEINSAFAISKDSPLWRAIMYRLGEHREAAIAATVGYVVANNPLGLAGASGQIEVLKNVVDDFNDLREKATKD